MPLYFRELGDQLEAGLALPVGADAVVGDKTLHRVKFQRRSAGDGSLKGRAQSPACWIVPETTGNTAGKIPATTCLGYTVSAVLGALTSQRRSCQITQNPYGWPLRPVPFGLSVAQPCIHGIKVCECRLSGAADPAVRPVPSDDPPSPRLCAAGNPVLRAFFDTRTSPRYA